MQVKNDQANLSKPKRQSLLSQIQDNISGLRLEEEKVEHPPQHRKNLKKKHHLSTCDSPRSISSDMSIDLEEVIDNDDMTVFHPGHGSSQKIFDDRFTCVDGLIPLGGPVTRPGEKSGWEFGTALAKRLSRSLPKISCHEMHNHTPHLQDTGPLHV